MELLKQTKCIKYRTYLRKQMMLNIGTIISTSIITSKSPKNVLTAFPRHGSVGLAKLTLGDCNMQSQDFYNW